VINFTLALFPGNKDSVSIILAPELVWTRYYSNVCVEICNKLVRILHGTVLYVCFRKVLFIIISSTCVVRAVCYTIFLFFLTN
jgi:hypothetical protein